MFRRLSHCTVLFFSLFIDTVLARDNSQEGMEWEVVYTGDYFTNLEGGLKEDEAYLSNLDLTLTLHTEKLGLWPNGKFFIYGLMNHDTGKLSGEIVGDMQTVSNIEAPRSVRLYEVWYEHRFGEDRLSLLMGQHDLNSEFVVTAHGSLFINSSFGIMPNISLNARPSIFPVTTFGGRAKWSIIPAWELLAGVYDGDPGSGTINKHNTRWILVSDQGLFSIAELAYKNESSEKDHLPGTYKVGFWHNSGDFTDVIDTDDAGEPIKRTGNMGGYFIADQTLFKETAEEGLGCFLQVGGAPKHINLVDFYIGGGLTYRGLVPHRHQDEIGLAIAHASISDDLVDAGNGERAETTLEITYRAILTEHLTLQPDVQFVFSPNADPSLNDAMVIGLRFELAL